LQVFLKCEYLKNIDVLTKNSKKLLI